MKHPKQSLEAAQDIINILEKEYFHHLLVEDLIRSKIENRIDQAIEEVLKKKDK